MTDFPFDCIGFDLDGTLVDTAPDLCSAVNHAIVRAGREPVSAEVTRELIGGGDSGHADPRFRADRRHGR